MKKRKAGTRPSKKRNLGKFKSGIEKYCNDQLRAAGLDFCYEEKEYLLMDKFRYPNRYLKMTAKRKDLRYLHSHHDFPMRWKLFLRHLVDNKMDCAVYIAKNKHQVDQVIADIKKLSDA